MVLLPLSAVGIRTCPCRIVSCLVAFRAKAISNLSSVHSRNGGCSEWGAPIVNGNLLKRAADRRGCCVGARAAMALFRWRREYST